MALAEGGTLLTVELAVGFDEGADAPGAHAPTSNVAMSITVAVFTLIRVRVTLRP